MNQKNLIYSGAIILLLILGFGLTVSAQMETPTALSLNYELTKVDKPLKAGSSGTLIVVIQNTGGLPAEEVRASILSTAGGVSASDTWNLGTINPGQLITLTTKISVANNVNPGTYIIPLKLDFRSKRYDSTVMGIKTTDEKSEWKIIVKVSGEANFQVTAEKQEFYKDVTSDLVLKGGVKQKISNVYAILYPTHILALTSGVASVSSTGEAASGASATSTASNCASIIGSEKVYLGNLEANQNFVLNYTIKPNTLGICSMSVSFDYDDASGSSETETETFGLEIKISNTDIKVSDIKYPLLNPGDTAGITFVLENVGSAGASDVTVTLGLSMEDMSKIPSNLLTQMTSEYPFVVVGSSEKYIKNFEGGEKKEVSFSVKINKDAKAKAYEIPLKIKYFDSAGAGHEISKIVGIEIRSKPEIELMIKGSEITKNKNIGKISVELINKGSSDAQFLNLKIMPTDQYSVISANEEYIGTLESDDSENVDFNIKINDTNVDAVPISLSIEYKDNYNDEYKKDLKVDLGIPSDSDLGNGGITFTTIIIVLIVLVVIYLVYKKIKK